MIERDLLVSVLIPVYNVERYVSAAIESVFSQDYPSIEVVAVNDGSTDRSREVLARYEGMIKVIDQQNRGAAAARNRALNEANGDYVLFFDGDDLLKDTHVSALVKATAAAGSSTISFSPWARFWQENPTEDFPARAARDAAGVDWLISEWRTAFPMLQPGMFLLPRALVERTGAWDERLTLIDDFEFYSRAISRCGGMRFASEAGLYYRSGVPSSLSGKKGRRAVESQFLSLILSTGHLLAVRSDDEARRACANLLQQFVYEHYPLYPDLRAKVNARIDELGGSDIGPIGPPNFHRLRRVVGWKAARRVQRAMGR